MIAFLGNTPGKIFDEKNYSVIKKSLAINEKVEKHNHTDNEVLLTVVKGEISIVLNDEENYKLEPGKILKFDGDNYISISANEQSEFFVTLIKK